MTAEVTLSDHPDGTDYRVVVRHGGPNMRSRHEDLGFRDGWGTVIEQLEYGPTFRSPAGNQFC
jgi:uncharacterized protein YndB with AHSA1/START domain